MTGGANYKAWYDGQLVRSETGDKWINIHEPEGAAIRKSANEKCNGKAIECRIER